MNKIIKISALVFVLSFLVFGTDGVFAADSCDVAEYTIPESIPADPWIYKCVDGGKAQGCKKQDGTKSEVFVVPYKLKDTPVGKACGYSEAPPTTEVEVAGTTSAVVATTPAVVDTTPVTTPSVESTVNIKSIKLVNPIDGAVGNEKGTVDLFVIFGRIIKGVMGIVGSLALLVFVAGGFMWLTSAGSPEQVKKGSQAMIWAAAGILVIFASYAILTMILDVFGVKGGSI